MWKRIAVANVNVSEDTHARQRRFHLAPYRARLRVLCRPIHRCPLADDEGEVMDFQKAALDEVRAGASIKDVAWRYGYGRTWLTAMCDLEGIQRKEHRGRPAKGEGDTVKAVKRGLRGVVVMVPATGLCELGTEWVISERAQDRIVLSRKG